MAEGSDAGHPRSPQGSRNPVPAVKDRGGVRSRHWQISRDRHDRQVGHGYLPRLQGRGDGQHRETAADQDRKSTRLNSSHGYISYAVFCLKKKNKNKTKTKKKKKTIILHYISCMKDQQLYD